MTSEQGMPMTILEPNQSLVLLRSTDVGRGWRSRSPTIRTSSR
jgi:hypothetical protein